MPSTILSDNGVSSGSAGLKTTAASDGALALQTTTAGGTATTAVTIDTSQRVAFVAGTAAAPAITTSGDTDTGIFFPAANTLAFTTNGTEDARFDASGNFGLGVTPSAWGVGRAIDWSVYGTINNFDDGTKGNFQVGYNYYQTNASTFIYKVGDLASMYRQRAGVHSWYTAASGTAGNAITFTQAMTLDASSNLQLNAGNLLIASGGSATYKVTLANTGSQTAGINWTTSSPVAYMDYYSLGVAGTWQGAHRFYVSNNSATPVIASTIDSSGRLLIGMTSAIGLENVQSTGAISGANQYNYFAMGATASYTCYALRTYSSSTSAVVGSITYTGTATAYNTSSDYRLKENIQPMTGALSKVAALKPVIYKWKTDGSDGEGFIAHELAEVCPHAVVGEKDAVETYTDEEGNEQTRPVYQGIDTSFLVATLTAAIQEQQAIIEQLKADVAALKGTQP